MFQYLYSRSRSRWVWLITTIGALALSGCIVGSDNDAGVDETASSVDQALAQELFDGWPAPQDMYEVRSFNCAKTTDRVEATMTIVNTNDFSWGFGVEAVFYTKDGEAIPSRTDPGFWEPGEEVELSQWTRPLDDFDDPPRCEINVYHGSDLAVVSEQTKETIYERLGWDPENEKRLDGS